MRGLLFATGCLLFSGIAAHAQSTGIALPNHVWPIAGQWHVELYNEGAPDTYCSATATGFEIHKYGVSLRMLTKGVYIVYNEETQPFEHGDQIVLSIDGVQSASYPVAETKGSELSAKIPHNDESNVFFQKLMHGQELEVNTGTKTRAFSLSSFHEAMANFQACGHSAGLLHDK